MSEMKNMNKVQKIKANIWLQNRPIRIQHLVHYIGRLWEDTIIDELQKYHNPYNRAFITDSLENFELLQQKSAYNASLEGVPEKIICCLVINGKIVDIDIMLI